MKIENFLEQSPVFLLQVAAENAQRGLSTILSAEGVHFLQALILTGMFFEDVPVRPSELAAALQTSRSNMSHAIRGLEKSKLIERTTASSDSRAYELTLTKLGQKKATRLIAFFDTDQARSEAVGGERLCKVLREFLVRSRLPRIF